MPPILKICSSNSGSGSGSGSSSIPHSFSVDEIQKMRVKLKSSKSFPNDLVHQEQQQHQPNKQLSAPNEVNGKMAVGNAEEDNNSSSGVSSDQELTVTHTSATFNEHQKSQNDTVSVKSSIQSQKQPESILKKPISLPPLSNVTKQIATAINIQGARQGNGVIDPRDEDFDTQMDSPSPPSKGFQRHNSLTRKQAATIAMNRAIQTRNAVSMKLPPTIEDESDGEHQSSHHQQQQQQKPHYGRTITTINTACNTIHSQNQHLTAPQRARNTGSSVVVVVPPPMVYDNKTNGDASPSQEIILLAPPPQFCDCTNANITKIMNNNNAAGLIAENNGMVTANSGIGGANRSVRIVGAVPKMTRMHQ